MYTFQQTDPRIVSRWSPEFLTFLQEGLVKYKKEEERAYKKAARKARGRKH